MTHPIIIETQSSNEFAQIKGLTQRLGLHTDEKHKETVIAESEQERLFQILFGNWQSDESGDELVAMLQSARQDSPRNVQL